MTADDAAGATAFLLGLSAEGAPLFRALESAARTGRIDPEIARALADAINPTSDAPVKLRPVAHRRGRRRSGERRQSELRACQIVREREAAGDAREASVAAAMHETGLSRAAVFGALAIERKLAAVGAGVDHALGLAVAEVVLKVVRELGPGSIDHLEAVGLWPPAVPPVPGDPVALSTAEAVLDRIDLALRRTG
jgi:hypothetical protein